MVRRIADEVLYSITISIVLVSVLVTVFHFCRVADEEQYIKTDECLGKISKYFYPSVKVYKSIWSWCNKYND